MKLTEALSRECRQRDGSIISIVVPCYNEAEVLPKFIERLTAAVGELPYKFVVLLVNDGSTDGTLSVMKTLAAQHSRIVVLNLSRNFGKEAAMTAGLDHAPGDAVIVIDADLQDPPEIIPRMILSWRAGADVVYAQRRVRDGETVIKRWTASAFYRIMQWTTNVALPADTGDFRLMSRRAVDSLLRLREHHRFMKGLFAWIGFIQVPIIYDRAPRQAGVTKWNYWKLWNFAIEGITSFSVLPLKFSTYFGFILALISGSYGIIIILYTLFYKHPIPGYPSILVIILFLGGYYPISRRNAIDDSGYPW